MDLDFKLQNLLSKLSGVKPSGNGHVAHCPGDGHAHGDKNRSLSVTVVDNKILLNCFTGCDPKEILNKLDMTWADLFPDSEQKTITATGGLTIDALAKDKGFPTDFLTSLGVSQGRNHVKIRYSLEDGTPAPRQRIRVALKAKDGSKWARGKGAVIPYGLWKLPEAREKGFIVFVEGESDSWTLWYHDFPALGFPGADMAGKLKLKHVDGIPKIYAVREPDQGGEAFIAGITKQFSSWKTWQGELFEVRLSELTGAKDPNDLHKREQSKFKEIFQNALDTAMRIEIKYEEKKSEKKAVQDIIAQGNFLTDLGNAARLVSNYGQNIRYCYQWGKWLLWDGKRWVKDNTGGIYRLAKETVRRMYAEASDIPDEDTRRALVNHALKSESEARLRAMVNLAQSEPGIPVTTEELDKDQWLLNCLNGTLDLRTGELRPHKREDLSTKIIPVEYNPEAKCPMFEKFLNDIFAENENLITFMRKAIGYSLTGSTREQVVFILYGTGANGKSVLIALIMSLLGDYALQTPTETLMVQKNEGIRNDLARLKGARFVSAVESDEGRRLSESVIKQLTGQDTISARFLHQEFFDFVPECKIFLATNHRPEIRGSDHGIWRRIRLIPFNVKFEDVKQGDDSFKGKRQDKDLLNKLKRELPGILAWAVKGCLKWQREGLEQPEEVKAATMAYQTEMDSIMNFISECCNVNIQDVKTASGVLHNVYTKWCLTNGERAVSNKKFSQRLELAGYTKERGSDGRVYWYGIGILASERNPEGYEGSEGRLPFSPIREKNIEKRVVGLQTLQTLQSTSNDDEDRWE
ncbi:MAG: hypothetical protein A4E52_01864 [Pelotomaculum sp. PtaB.Bin013]|uniref:Phage/plasmid primase, P4 family n=1 Tax=Pelotomaculum isophthalicicum JI TaxID=947010 RepID=A0A9X4H4V9_9FIRM|nr:phage/plasmid primase, P4 family [Pelotomaculum isophthalicicum]MDF9409063.1 phage/plasmid primase, P4 family [Pelotomaculum isophthalicicum JI]OPX83290.1 MAG: hypothetical protein A4E52_01864 [Pelotomaculum sp. PtaB.Bin013]